MRLSVSWAFVTASAAAVAIFLISHHPSPAVIVKPELASPAGWDDLAPCASLGSLDGTRDMRFTEDHGAEFWDTSPLKEGQDPKSQIVQGVWGYDAGSKRYAIVLNGETTTYTLLARGEPVTCMLIKGDLGAADLSASWFSFPVNEDPGD